MSSSLTCPPGAPCLHPAPHAPLLLLGPPSVLSDMPDHVKAFQVPLGLDLGMALQVTCVSAHATWPSSRSLLGQGLHQGRPGTHPYLYPSGQGQPKEGVSGCNVDLIGVVWSEGEPHKARTF